jgi:predicted transcriptional regulator
MKMAILKAPPRPPKNETVQIRLEKETRDKLHKYAEFIDSSESYVVSEALKLLFRKDDEFKIWLDQQPRNGVQPHADRKEEPIANNGASTMPQQTRPKSFSVSCDTPTLGQRSRFTDMSWVRRSGRRLNAWRRLWTVVDGNRRVSIN